MIATWMLYGTVIAALAGIAALFLERGARVIGRAGRWGWAGAIAISLALPLTSYIRPAVPQSAVFTLPGMDGRLQFASPATVTAPAIRYHEPRRLAWADLDRPLLATWALVTIGLLGWFATGVWRLQRMRGRWRTERMEGGQVLVSEDIGPAVIGFFRCRVVVPDWTLDLERGQRELLLMHEAEHVAAHDSRLLLLAALVVALVPWNVGLWWHYRRLRVAIELDCDARVLRRRPDRAGYGRLLIDVGSRAARTLVPVAAFHEPVSSLERRIRTLSARRPRWAALWATGTVVAAAAAIFAACEAPRPTAPVKSAPFSIQMKQEDGIVRSTFIADSVRRYFLDATTHQPVFLWFLVSPDRHVVRYGYTPRDPARHAIRPEAVDSVIPGFEYDKTQSVTIVGENAIRPGSPPVYWAVLRDPAKPATWLPPEVDSLALLPWVREGLQKYWGPVMAAKSGPPEELWFVSDRHHHIFTTFESSPAADSGRGVGTYLISRFFPGITPDMVVGFSTGTAHSWARSNLQIVWVTLRDGPATERWARTALRDTIRVTGR